MQVKLLFYLKCALLYVMLPIIGYQFGMAFKWMILHPLQYLYFIIGFTGCFMLMRFYGGQRLAFAQTFTHELIHTIFTYLSFGKVYAFTVKDDTGCVMTDRSDIAMTLAPYFFPLYTILLLSIRPGIMSSYLPYFDFICGSSFAFYIDMIRKQTGLWQTDIRSKDWRLSYPFVILMVFLFSYLVISGIRHSLWFSIRTLAVNVYHSFLAIFDFVM